MAIDTSLSASHENLRGLDLHAPSNELVENNSGSTITKLKVVTFDRIGTLYPEITPIANLGQTPRGIVPADILDGSTGMITAFGVVVDADTSSFTLGARLYSDSSGNLTTTDTGLNVGTVLKVGTTDGIIWVNLITQGPPGPQIASISVADINDPTPELSLLSGTAEGDGLIIYEAVASGENPIVLYAWDTSGGVPSPPFSVQGNGGVWVATTSTYFTRRFDETLIDASKFHGHVFHTHGTNSDPNGGRWWGKHDSEDHEILTDVRMNRTAISGTEIDFYQGDTVKTKTLSVNPTAFTIKNAKIGRQIFLEIASGAGEDATFPSTVTEIGDYDPAITNYGRLICLNEGARNSATVQITNNSFDAGDAITLNGVALTLGTEWTAGATIKESCIHLARSIEDSTNPTIQHLFDVTFDGVDTITISDRDSHAGSPFTLTETDGATDNFTVSAVSGGADPFYILVWENAATNEFLDTLFRIQDDGDNTKKVAFEVSGVTTGTTRTITMPDKNITLDTNTDSRPPNGAAGGDLGGTYPNPTVNDGADSTAIHDNTANEISAIAEKATPVTADLLLIEDSAASNVKKKIQIGNLPVPLPVVDTTAIAKGSVDDTKQVRMEVDGLTTGTTRVITIPDKDVTIDDVADSRPPSGAAGGDLGGTYPNPTVNDGADSTAIHDNVANEISAVTEKGTPVNTDTILIEDSAAGNVKKKIQIGNLPAPLPAVDTTAIVKGSVDATKQIRFEVDGLTTGTTRVITPPDKDITLDDVTDSRPPNGAAGGDLGGTYPNPTVNDGADSTAIHDNVSGEINAITEKATPVAADILLIEDSAVSNTKKKIQVGNLPVPLPVVDTTAIVKGSVDPTKQVRIEVDGLTTSTTRVITMPDKDVTIDDIADSRTPTAHATSHQSGGSDAIKLDDLAAPDDNTDLNASTTKHGLLPKLSGDSSQFLNGNGAFVKPFPIYEFFADDFLSPVNSDWAVNSLAPVAVDSNSARHHVRLFDDTTEEGVGFDAFIPSGATNIKFTFISRAETAPAGVRTVGLKLYECGNIPGAPDAWSAGTTLTDIDIPTSEDFVEDSQTISLATLGLTAGKWHKFELTRVNPSAGTELVGDWDLFELRIEFT